MKIAMKALILGLVLTWTLIYLPGCGATGLNFAQLESDGHEIRIYEVFGMDCPGCHGGLENLVNQVQGVKTSQANWEKQQLKVALHPDVEVDDDAIWGAVKSANFTPGKRIK